MEDRKCQEDQKLQEVLVKATPLAVCSFVFLGTGLKFTPKLSYYLHFPGTGSRQSCLCLMGFAAQGLVHAGHKLNYIPMLLRQGFPSRQGKSVRLVSITELKRTSDFPDSSS